MKMESCEDSSVDQIYSFPRRGSLRCFYSLVFPLCRFPSSSSSLSCGTGLFPSSTACSRSWRWPRRTRALTAASRPTPPGETCLAKPGSPSTQVKVCRFALWGSRSRWEPPAVLAHPMWVWGPEAWNALIFFSSADNTVGKSAFAIWFYFLLLDSFFYFTEKKDKSL